MGHPLKYHNDEDRIKAYKEQQNNYGKKKWSCTVCECEIINGSKTKHLKSKKHQKNLDKRRDSSTSSESD